MTKRIERTTDPTALAFRPLGAADLPMLHEWLGRPHVAEWWETPPPSLDDVIEEYGIRVGASSPHHAYIVQLDDAPIGFVQSYTAVACHAEGWWQDEHDPGLRGIDQFIAEADWLGRGLGSAMVRAFTDRLFTDATVTRVQTDPSPTNARAIRAYEKAGFRPVREIVTPDGPALLMYRDRPHPT